MALRRIIASNEAPAEMEKLRAGASLGSAWPELLTQLPELELYFPIERHRREWTPDQPFLVAVPYEGRDSFRLLYPNGTGTNVSVRTEPAIPTLVLGPSEIEYDDTASSLVGGSRTGDGISASTGLMRPAAWSGARSLSMLTHEQAWHMSYIRVLQMHDGGLAGNDEAETFGYWGDNMGGLSFPDCARYTGLNTSNGGWLAVEDPRDRFTLWVPIPCSWCNGGIYVTAYEDDSQNCVLTSSDDFYGNITDYAPVAVNTVQRFMRWGSPGHIEEAWEPRHGH